jgi:hypothetical protein
MRDARLLLRHKPDFRLALLEELFGSLADPYGLLWREESIKDRYLTVEVVSFVFSASKRNDLAEKLSKHIVQGAFVTQLNSIVVFIYKGHRARGHAERINRTFRSGFSECAR